MKDALDSPAAVPLFASVLVALEEELDWPRLGRTYCAEGGEDFFDPESLAAIRDTGLLFASDVAAEIESLRGGAGGASLYVGAAVAELAPGLFEALVLGRTVILHNLPGVEADELNRALSLVGDQQGVQLPEITTTDLGEQRGPFDHVWLASVLTDPDHFPALHNKLYERTGARAAPGGDAGQETLRARRLMRSVLELVRPPAVFTTSDEESTFLVEAARRAGLRATRPEAARLSAIVGDPLRIWRLNAKSS